MQIFIKGNNIHLNLFLDAMAKGCDDAVFLDYSDKEGFERELIKLDPQIDSSTRVICFNNIGVVTILHLKRRKKTGNTPWTTIMRFRTSAV